MRLPILIDKSLEIWLIRVLKKFTAAFAMLLATWQLIVRSDGIIVLLFYDQTPLTRLYNHPLSCLQLLLNLLSSPPSLLMWYLPYSVRTLLISQHNLPNQLLSLGNLLMPFNSLRTRSSHNLHDSPQVVLRHYSSFLLLLRNPECRVLPILLRPRHLAGFLLLWNLNLNLNLNFYWLLNCLITNGCNRIGQIGQFEPETANYAINKGC